MASDCLIAKRRWRRRNDRSNHPFPHDGSSIHSLSCVSSLRLWTTRGGLAVSMFFVCLAGVFYCQQEEALVAFRHDCLHLTIKLKACDTCDRRLTFYSLFYPGVVGAIAWLCAFADKKSPSVLIFSCQCNRSRRHRKESSVTLSSVTPSEAFASPRLLASEAGSIFQA